MEQICYYCRHCIVADIGMISRKCEKTGKMVETFDTCRDCDTSRD